MEMVEYKFKNQNNVSIRTKSGKKTSIYLDIYSNGSRQYEFLKLYLTGDKNQDKLTIKTVEQIAVKRQNEIQNNVIAGYGIINHSASKKRLLKDFINEYCINGKSENTVIAYDRTFKKIKSFFRENNKSEIIRLSDINKESFKSSFIKFLKEQNLKDKSIKMHLNLINAVVNLAIAEKIFTENLVKIKKK